MDIPVNAVTITTSVKLTIAEVAHEFSATMMIQTHKKDEIEWALNTCWAKSMEGALSAATFVPRKE